MVIAAIGSFGYKVMFFLHILSVIVAFAHAFVNPYGEDAIDLIVTGQWSPPASVWRSSCPGFCLG